MARGTTNTNSRGNARDRARRKAWLLVTFGDGTTAPCAFCGTELTFETVTVDREVPGCLGGRYVRGNIRPACGPCNSSDGATRCKSMAETQNPKSKGTLLATKTVSTGSIRAL